MNEIARSTTFRDHYFFGADDNFSTVGKARTDPPGQLMAGPRAALSRRIRFATEATQLTLQEPDLLPLALAAGMHSLCFGSRT